MGLMEWTDRELLEELAEVDGHPRIRMTPWEIEFVDSVLRLERLSTRQRAIVTDLLHKYKEYRR